MKNKYPIIESWNGENEIVSPLSFSQQIPQVFKNVEQVKQKGIKRCFLVFYDNAEDNQFLNTLNVVFKFHAGSVTTNVYEYKNALIAIAPLGGPAAATLMEELSIFGINEFIAIGSAGCLNEKIKDKFVIVNKAIRDEGLSYHYIRPSTYISTDKALNGLVENYLKENNFDYKKIITWTNDAYYRETDKKVEMAKKLGAEAVEMECASWCAVAKFRGFKFSQLLYFSDLLTQDAWERLIHSTKDYHNKKQEAIILIVKDMIEKM